MSAVIDTDLFVKGISAARVMAYSGNDDPTFASVVLATGRVEADGPGTQNSLVFLSSDGISPGQTIFPADGELEPVRISRDQASQLLAAAKGAASAAKKIDKESQCGVELSVVDNGSTLLVRTLTDGECGQADSRHYYPLLDIDGYPLDDVVARLSALGSNDVMGMLTVDDDQTAVPLKVGKVQSFTEVVLKKQLAISAVFKKEVNLFTTRHPASLVTLTCAGVFRAVITAHAYSPEIDVDEPDVPVVPGLAGER